MRLPATHPAPPPSTHRSRSHVPAAWTAVVGLLIAAGVATVLLAPVGVAAERPAAEPPSVATLERRATGQGFTAIQLLGNDAVGAAGSRVVVARVGRAWEAAKRMYLGQPQDREKAAALREVFERWQRQADRLHGNEDRNDWKTASVRLRLLAPAVAWPGETTREHRTRVAAVLAADRASSADFWKQVREAKDKEPSDSVKAVCGVIALGPSVVGAIGAALQLRGGADQTRQIREACEKTGQRVRDTTETVAKTAKDVVTDPLGTLAKGVFGPLLSELQKAATYASKQVGAAIDKVAAPDLSERWVRQMLKRSATIAVLIAVVAGILGVIHAAVTANLSALMSVVGRALLSGVVGSVLLAVLHVAIVFVDLLTAVAIGAEPGQTGKRFASFADTATKAMAAGDVPSFVALLLLLALLLALVIVWWEMWLRAPLLYAVAFFYGPAYSAGLFAPARQLLSHLNALLAAIVVMPLVVLSLLEMAVASLQSSDTINAVLQAVGLLLLAAASPAILVALFSPSVALSAAAGMAGALGTGRAIGRAGRRATGGAASATLGAAGFAKDRLSDSGGRRPGTDGSGGGPSSNGPSDRGGDGRTGGVDRSSTTPNVPADMGSPPRLPGNTSVMNASPGLTPGSGGTNGARASRGDAAAHAPRGPANAKTTGSAGPNRLPGFGDEPRGEGGPSGAVAASNTEPTAGPGSPSPADALPGHHPKVPLTPPTTHGAGGSGASTPPPPANPNRSNPPSRRQPPAAPSPPSDRRRADRPPRPNDRPPDGGGLIPPDSTKESPDA